MDKFDPNSMQEAMRLASTPAGQRLIQHLQQTDSSNLQAAMNQASSGDYEAAKKILSQMISSPEVKKLMEQLGR